MTSGLLPFSSLWKMAATLVVFVLIDILMLCSSDDSDPVIPAATDEQYLEFQRAVGIQQDLFSTPVLFSDLESYNNTFQQFKTGAGELVGELVAPTSQVDADFAAFEKFIQHYSRVYNNMDEFVIRFHLFLTALNAAKGYNVGDDLAGTNYLSDRTQSEKKAHYG